MIMLEFEEAQPREQYFTPPECTLSLLERVRLQTDLTIGEPCAGDRWIANVLADRGIDVISADVDTRLENDHPGLDFFSGEAERIFGNVDGIVSNPPWSDAARFVRRALEFSPNVAMLLRLSFLEPCEKGDKSRRLDLLELMSGLIVLPRVSFIRGKRGTDSLPPAWFIWGFDPDFVLDFVSGRELAELSGQLTLGV
jgi:hypothetical protein